MRAGWGREEGKEGGREGGKSRNSRKVIKQGHTHLPSSTPTPTPTYPLPTGGWMTPSIGGGLGGGALTTGMGRGQAIVPPLNLDVKEKSNEFEIAVDAPGMKKEGTFVCIVMGRVGGLEEWRVLFLLSFLLYAYSPSFPPSLPPSLLPDFDVTFDNNVLRVVCERKEEKEEEDARWHISERRWGSSSRSVRLPRTAGGENIKAEYDAGVLKVMREGGEGGEGGEGRRV